MAEQALMYLEGRWQTAQGSETFRAVDPFTGEAIGAEYPVSTPEEIERVLEAAAQADLVVRNWPAARFADFLDRYASSLEAHAEELIELAHQETALPVAPRLKAGELPRTVNQLRLAAQSARTGEWALPTIDAEANIRSCYRSIGPTFLLGPNNFPLAYNALSGGDFAAAVAVGNPVIAKGHPSHPNVTRRLAELVAELLDELEFPPGFVQLIYHMPAEAGLKLVADDRLATVGFTGSRAGGLAIKAVADEHGKPMYAELSSINPVFILPGAMQTQTAAIAEEFSGSCLLGSGQFCTNPGLVILPPCVQTVDFIEDVKSRFQATQCGPMFSAAVRDNFLKSVEQLQQAGAELLLGGHAVGETGYRVASTLLKISAKQFLAQPLEFQREAFGTSSLLVQTDSCDQMLEIARQLEGQLTGSIYTAESAEDEACYAELEPELRRHVGRLLNNKMPTGVAVSPAMNHGGPFPATGHPGFTAVGLPPSLRRFAMLACYDNVPEHRLPEILRSH